MNTAKTKEREHEDKVHRGKPVTNLPAAQPAGGGAVTVVDFGDDAGKGMENVTSDETRIPIIRVLQALSPQCGDVRQGGLGLKPGTVFNTATGEVIDGEVGFDFVPFHRDHNFVEWTPRIQGGGFVAMHAPDDGLVLKLKGEQGRFGKLSHGVTRRNEKGEALDGTEIAETFYLYGLVLQDGQQPSPAVIAFTSMQIKKYQAFIARYMSITYKQKVKGTEDQYQDVTPPLWAHRWHVETVPEKNKKGSFFGWRFSLSAKGDDGKELPTVRSLIAMADPLYQQAKALYLMAKGGRASADLKKAGSESTAADEEPM